jgi:predicted chitinase
MNEAVDVLVGNIPANEKNQECHVIATFVAQLAHESHGFRYFEEIASGAAYEWRKDLGNSKAGDGRRYKGRGPIQLTGRNNYRAAAKFMGVPIEEKPGRWTAAAFRTHGRNSSFVCDHLACFLTALLPLSLL